MGIKRQCRALGRSENRGGGGGSGASRNLRPFEWEGFAFFPSKTTLTSIWKHCAPLLLRRPYNGKFVTDCFLIWWHEKKDRKKLGNRKKNSSVFILDKNLGHTWLCCPWGFPINVAICVFDLVMKKECPYFSQQTLGWLLQAHQNKNCSCCPKSHSKS